MVGGGNAPFSNDMYVCVGLFFSLIVCDGNFDILGVCLWLWNVRYDDGYEGIVNTDISAVVIQQQREACPEMRWEVMDVRSMDFPEGYFDVVMDKSLIDTVMCYQIGRASCGEDVGQ